MYLPEFLRRALPEAVVVDLSTPEAQAEYVALLEKTNPAPHHVVDFAGLPEQPSRWGPRRQYPCPVPVVRASDGAVYE